MSQIRIGFGRVPAGSAARQAEGESRDFGTPRPMRVQAGSAARAAEDAKRAGGDGFSSGASFSLRAQGGRVQRVDAESAPARGVAAPAPLKEAHNISVVETQALDVHAASVRPVEVANGELSSGAAAPGSAKARLTSFIRGLFLPEESS